MNTFIMESSVVRPATNPYGRLDRNSVVGYEGEHNSRSLVVETTDDLSAYASVSLIIDDLDCGAMTKTTSGSKTVLSLTLTSAMIGASGRKLCQLLMVDSNNTVIAKSSQFVILIKRSNDIERSVEDGVSFIIISEAVTEMAQEAASAAAQEAVADVVADCQAIADDASASADAAAQSASDAQTAAASIVVDSALDATSTHALQNKVVTSEINALKADLDAQVADINESLKEYNSYNLLDFFGHVDDATKYGVTFTFNNRHTVILNGMSTRADIFLNLFHDKTALPNELMPDKNYIVSVKSSNDDVKLQITFYNSDGNVAFQKYFYGDSVIYVDNTYVGVNFRIYVDCEIGDSYVNDTIEVSILEEPYHLNEKNIHTIQQEIDFNDIVDSGTYMLLGSSYNHVNAPTNFKFGYLEVVSSYTLSSGDHNIIQTLYSTKPSGTFCYIRSYYLSSWKAWERISISENELATFRDSISSMANAIEDLYVSARLYDTPVKIFRYPAGDRWFYIRTKFYGEFDVVYSFGTPGYAGIDNAFSFDYIKLIPSSTPLTAEDTVSAYESASIYKFCKDEIPAIHINGVFVGSNHGNPNYTLVVSSSHGQSESDIGTVWLDSDNFEYTLVNVLNDNRLIFGTLDSNGFLVARNPEALTKQNGGGTINVTSSASYQLRRSAINRVYKYYNENGIDLALGGSGNNVIISEDYDINDQSAGLAYLQDNVGTCTNSSYYDNAQTEHLAHIHNIFQFNRGGSITVYGSLTAKKNIVADTIFGMMSGIFGRDDNPRPDYMYVPNSGNATNIVTIDTSNAWSPTLADDGSMHYRYYQLTSDNNAHFLQFLNNYGDVNSEERRLLPYTSSAYYSVNAKKFYLNVAKSKALSNGDIYSWSYGRGPYKYSDSQTVLTYFDVGNGYVVSMDWHNGHSGYVKLPDYMSGMKVNVLDKTDSVTNIQEHTCLSGLKLNCSGYGYAVLLLS